MKLQTIEEFINNNKGFLYKTSWLDNFFILKNINSYFRRKRILKKYKKYLFYKVNNINV